MALQSLQYAKATCPISLDEIISFVGTFSADEDALIQRMANAATNLVERYIGDFLVQRPITWVSQKSTYELTQPYFDSWLNGPMSAGFVTLSAFGQFIMLPTKATSVTDVSVLVSGTNLVSLTEGISYNTDLLGNTGRIRFNFDEFMVSLFQGVTAIKIDYVGGMYATSDQIPDDIINVILVLTKRSYEDRQRLNGSIISNGIEKELINYRNFSFG
jgi:hypothetical protein